ncbi:hypothetical protein HK1_01543 [Tepidibacillus sp. HK-1]|nr:hypothetical protein HK1_01543 [Tepidibacillus sp. HK-1]
MNEKLKAFSGIKKILQSKIHKNKTKKINSITNKLLFSRK